MIQVEKLEVLVWRAVENDFKPRFFSWVPEDESDNPIGYMYQAVFGGEDAV